jgi:hypothetical protein
VGADLLIEADIIRYDASPDRGGGGK